MQHTACGYSRIASLRLAAAVARQKMLSASAAPAMNGNRGASSRNSDASSGKSDAKTRRTYDDVTYTEEVARTHIGHMCCAE
uniref:Secreted protein n=1 Tax=Ascaris lumbricoides TaxID=6252 RepID=A0A0M3IFP0_ASCLU